MNNAASKIDYSHNVFSRYRDNFPRHVFGVTRYLQTGIMTALADTHGYTGLRLSFDPFIALIGEQGVRPGDAAKLLRMSKQACNQIANQMETAGYIQRATHSDDGRAKLFKLTRQGKKLRHDGDKLSAGLHQQFITLVGEAELHRTAATLDKLCTQLGLTSDTSGAPLSGAARFVARLSRLSDHVMNRLLELTMVKGHPDLKLSFGQVLTLLGPLGGRIQTIAATLSVSKQAISVIVGELEALHYIRRDLDPSDSRQWVLQFTDQGRALLTDTVASIDELEQEFRELIGAAALTQLQATLKALYFALRLEADGTAQTTGSIDLQRLSQQLKQQLGTRGAAELAALLLAKH